MKCKNKGQRDNNYDPVTAKKIKQAPPPSTTSTSSSNSSERHSATTVESRNDIYFKLFSTVRTKLKSFCELFDIALPAAGVTDLRDARIEELVPTWAWKKGARIDAFYEESSFLPCYVDEKPLTNSVVKLNCELKGSDSSNSHTKANEERKTCENSVGFSNSYEENLKYVWQQMSSKDTSELDTNRYKKAVLDLFVPVKGVNDATNAFQTFVDINPNTSNAAVYVVRNQLKVFYLLL